MLVYQQHGRIIRLLSEVEKPILPAKFLLEVELSPASALGGQGGVSRLALIHSQVTFGFNVITGMPFNESDKPFPPVDIQIVFNNMKFDFQAEKLYIEGTAENYEWLANFLYMLENFLLSLLNLALSDPPIISNWKGKIGDVDFQWEYNVTICPVQVESPESLEEKIVNAVMNFTFLSKDGKNVRLLAAIQYYRIARRLVSVGSPPREFLAEALLNLAKTLEVLFGDRDNVRAALKELGYSETTIERDYIPILILRSYWGVAHPRIAILSSKDIDVIYHFFTRCERKINDLILHLIVKVKKGDFQLNEVSLELKNSEEKHFNELIEMMRHSMN